MELNDWINKIEHNLKKSRNITELHWNKHIIYGTTLLSDRVAYRFTLSWFKRMYMTVIQNKWNGYIKQTNVHVL